MKKLLLVMLVVAGFVACNNKSETKEENKMDTVQVQPTPPTQQDTTHVDTSAVKK